MTAAPMISVEGLVAIMPLARARARRFVEPLNAAMAEFGIDTPVRAAAFLAQIAHESGQLLYPREIWGPTPVQRRYEGRGDLGNTEPGDGKRFMGRGLIQITGRANYHECSLALFGDDTLLRTPELLETPLLACRSAAWFWAARQLNTLADAGDFRQLTRRINGGFNGWQQRVAYHQRARAALGVAK